MCQYCEHCVPIMENEHSITFIVAGRLILQDKTTPKVKPSFVTSELTHGEEEIWYESKWVHIKVCPLCNRSLE